MVDPAPAPSSRPPLDPAEGPAQRRSSSSPPPLAAAGPASTRRATAPPADLPPAPPALQAPRAIPWGSAMVGAAGLLVLAAPLYLYARGLGALPHYLTLLTVGLALVFAAVIGASDPQARLSELTAGLLWLAPYVVRPTLLVVSAGTLLLAYKLLVPWSGGPWITVGVLALTATPNLLTAVVSFLMSRRVKRRWSVLIPDEDPSGADPRWEARKRLAEETWRYEDELMHASIQRMSRHGAVFGFLASSILVICAAIALPQQDPNLLRYLIPLTTGTSVFVSFTLNLGRLLFRSASNDATARMMASSARSLLVVSVTTVFLSAVLLAGTQSQGNAGFTYTGVKGALIIGVAAGLIGERVLSLVTDRAALLLGVSSLSARELSELAAIDGLTEEDVARLAEERIDSVHALAFMPTPRLFFATIYSLQRICDWQDQALLIDRFGRNKAQILREKYLVKGATEAGRLAHSACDFQALAAALGFNDESQARRALSQLAREEMVQRLEVFSRATPCFSHDGRPAFDGRG